MEKEAWKIRTEIKRVDPRNLVLLKDNARYMTHEQFTRLVENVKRDGCLTSAPFVWHNLVTDEMIVMSGNHRVKAAVSAGLPEIDVIVTINELSESQRLAIQISHNSIAGQDDIATLKTLYEKIIDMELKEYSGVDDKSLNLMKDVNPMSIGEATLKYQTLTMVFLPDEMEEAKKVIESALKLTKDDAKWLVRFGDYDKWLDSIELAGSSYGIKNVATAINIILTVFERHIGDLREGWDNEGALKNKYATLSTVIGTDKIPVSSARAMSKACDLAVSRKEVKKDERWKLLERLCDEYVRVTKSMGSITG